MSISSVGVSLRSDTRTLEELCVLAGTQPDLSHVKGARVSPRLPPTKVYRDTYWSKSSEVSEETWTLTPHWPSIARLLESISNHDLDGVTATLSIGTNSRASGFAFDLEPEQIALLARAHCGVWIDSYEANRVTSDRPDDYPFPEGGSLHALRGLARARMRFNATVRKFNPFGKVRRHGRKAPTGTNA